MQRHSRFRFAMLAGALALCAACSEHPGEATVAPSRSYVSQPMVHGHEDASGRFDAVVMLSFPQSQSLCSGTLIAPDTVLTAAHCIPSAWRLQTGVQHLHRDEVLKVQFHRGRRQLTTRTAIAVAVHDDYHGLIRSGRNGGDEARRAYHTFAQSCGSLDRDAGDTCLSTLDRDVRHHLGLDRLWPTHDVALVFLAAPVPEIPPARILDDQCCENLVRKHAPVVLVGYGQQRDTAADRGNIGAVRHGHNHIVDIGEGELRVDGGNKAHPCFGDSGGPVFAEVDHDGERGLVQVGIASRVWDFHAHRGCASGLAYTRIDHERTFIRDSMRDAVIEGVRHPDDAQHDPHFAPSPASAAASCSQGLGAWGWSWLIALGLLARSWRGKKFQRTRAATTDAARDACDSAL